MSELKRLRQVVETNFRLNIMHTRELGIQMNRQMAAVSGKMSEMSEHLATLSRDVGRLGEEMVRMGHDFQAGMEANAARDQEIIDAFNQLLDSGVDVNKRLDDHEKRLRKLEEREDWAS